MFGKTYNLSFLFRVVSGIFLSIMIFSQFILLIIRNHPIALWSLFFGLILASILFLLKETDRLNFKNSKFIIPAQLLSAFTWNFCSNLCSNNQTK